MWMPRWKVMMSWEEEGVVPKDGGKVAVGFGRGSWAVARPGMISAARGLALGTRLWWRVVMRAWPRRKASGRREYRGGRTARRRVWMSPPKARRVCRVKASFRTNWDFCQFRRGIFFFVKKKDSSFWTRVGGGVHLRQGMTAAFSLGNPR